MSTSHPLVSVIVPIYKVEPYLRRCLDSLLAQEYPNLEIVLVDDGSPDTCPVIVDEYAAAHPGCFMVIHQENQGLGMARNNGIAASHGDYIAFVDSDDFVEPDFISRMMRIALTRNVDIVVCNYWIDLPHAHTPYPLLTPRKEMTGDEAARRALGMLGIPTNAWNKLYRRRMFDTVQFPPIYYEDIAVAAQLLVQARRVGITHKPLYHYAYRDSGITGTFRARNVYDYLTAIDIIRHFVHERGLWEDWNVSYRRCLSRVRKLMTFSLHAQNATMPKAERAELMALVRSRLRELREPPTEPMPPVVRSRS